LTRERPYRQKEWVLTSESFVKLLARLDADVNVAGEKYETLRRTLIKFFEWRNAIFPEDHADETLNRVARKIDEGLEIRDLSGYCYGVARLLHLETSKSPDTRRAGIEDLANIEAPALETVDEQRLRCFETCLESLPSDSRLLITEYYQHDQQAKITGRKKLAQRLGIPINALRSRATRIRDRLENCVNYCMGRKSG
jgi:DNA-directed RNA polymerase specialized sigma24 family protein